VAEKSDISIYKKENAFIHLTKLIFARNIMTKVVNHDDVLVFNEELHK